MARDARQLRQEAAEATSAGKHKRALGAYLELETLEPRDAQWPKRAGETYRKLARNNDAIDAFTRAADRYAQGGFLVQAMAVCKLILQIDPRSDAALQRIAAMNEQIGAGPTRAVTMADNNPNLADNTAVAALRRRGTTDQQQIADFRPRADRDSAHAHPEPDVASRSADDEGYADAAVRRDRTTSRCRVRRRRTRSRKSRRRGPSPSRSRCRRTPASKRSI